MSLGAGRASREAIQGSQAHTCTGHDVIVGPGICTPFKCPRVPTLGNLGYLLSMEHGAQALYLKGHLTRVKTKEAVFGSSTGQKLLVVGVCVINYPPARTYLRHAW